MPILLWHWHAHCDTVDEATAILSHWQRGIDGLAGRQGLQKPCGSADHSRCQFFNMAAGDGSQPESPSGGGDCGEARACHSGVAPPPRAPDAVVEVTALSPSLLNGYGSLEGCAGSHSPRPPEAGGRAGRGQALEEHAPQGQGSRAKPVSKRAARSARRAGPKRAPANAGRGDAKAVQTVEVCTRSSEGNGDVSGQRPPEDTVGDDSGSRSTPEGTVGEDSGSFYTPHGTVGDDGGSDKLDDAASSPERVCVGIRAEQYADDNMDTATDCASSVDTSGCCSVAVFPHGTQPRPPEGTVGDDSDDYSTPEATVGDDTGSFTTPECTVGEDSGSDKLDDAAISPERAGIDARAELTDDEGMRTATDRASSVDASGCCSVSVACLPTDFAVDGEDASYADEVARAHESLAELERVYCAELQEAMQPGLLALQECESCLMQLWISPEVIAVVASEQPGLLRDVPQAYTELSNCISRAKGSEERIGPSKHDQRAHDARRNTREEIARCTARVVPLFDQLQRFTCCLARLGGLR